MSDVCGQKFNTTETDEHKARRMQLRQTHLRAGSLRATRDAFLRANMVNTDAYWFDTVDVVKKSKCKVPPPAHRPYFDGRRMDDRHSLNSLFSHTSRVLKYSAQFSRIEAY